jgi:hypothetical protein
MNRAHDQLHEEQTYPALADFLRSGGKLEICEDFSDGGFVRIRKYNKTIVVHGDFWDFTAILKVMDSKAKKYLEQKSE